MIDLRTLNAYRSRDRERMIYPGENPAPHELGAFTIPMGGLLFFVLASSGGGWDHVSVSTPVRCPTWEEMETIKRMFFREDECAMQLHPPLNQYRNCHPFCLHIWKPLYQEIPLPPLEFVAPC